MGKILIIDLVILILFLILVLLSLRKSRDWLKSIDKKEHTLFPLYPMADWILTGTRLGKLFIRKDNITESLKTLNYSSRQDQIQRLFWCKRISLVLLIVVLFDILSLFSLLMGMENSDLLNGKYIKRPESGYGSRQVELNVIMKHEKEAGNKEAGNKETSNKETSDKEVSNKEASDKESSDKRSSGLEANEKGVNEKESIGKTSEDKESYDKKSIGKETDDRKSNDTESNNTESIEEKISTKKVTIDVDERIYNQDELEDVFNNSFQYLHKYVLGQNSSADKIEYNLNFCSAIPGTGIKVEWDPENTELIEPDGTIHNEGINNEGIDEEGINENDINEEGINENELNKEGVSTKVKVILTYYNQKSEQSMTFNIMPKQYTEEELFDQELKNKIREASKQTANDKLFKLPDSIEDYQLSWIDDKEENKSNSIMLLLLGIVMAAAAWIAVEKELDKKIKHRKEQMLLDYPELVNKFTLLVNAGMTIKQAWNKIVDDYLEKAEKGKGKKRHAYEEMLITSNELKLGQPEDIAYEQYGRRIGLIPYIKFSSLISQNLKKGNKGFTDLLMREAMEAFDERKEIAKRLGEEAGTKLLIPMMLMLIMVFLIIMIPAFWAFKV